MLRIHVRKNLHLGIQEPAVSASVGSFTFDQTLIGQSRAAVNIDTNELSIYRGRDRNRALGIIAENVHAEWQTEPPLDLRRDQSHERQRLGRHASGVKRSIAEVFYYAAVDT